MKAMTDCDDHSATISSSRMDSSGSKNIFDYTPWTQKKNGIESTVKDNFANVSEAKKYLRGNLKCSRVKERHSSLQRTLRETQKNIVESAKSNASTEILLPAEAGFLDSDEKKVFKITQKELTAHVDMNANRNILDLHLPELGPYLIKHSKNGKYQLFGGKRGHIAVMDCHNCTINLEMQLQEVVHDIQYLHDESLFAVAQNKYAYLYDSNGVEIHCLKRHERPHALDFLRHHFLLVTTGHSGWIKWHDVSTGQYMGGYGSGYGPCKVLTHNSQNAVSHMGHINGIVSLWSPISSKSLVSIFAHKASISDIAVNKEGTSMVTSALDGLVKVWDLRMYKELYTFKVEQPVLSLDVSDTALLALGMGRSVQVLKDVFSNPSDISYLQHHLNLHSTPKASAGRKNYSLKNSLTSQISVCSIEFRPFEDVLSIGHSHGITNITVPGSGEVNFDSYEINPYLNSQQRRETEIKSLLSKLEPGMIEVDGRFVGSAYKSENALNQKFETVNKLKTSKNNERKRTRGRNRISAKLRRKQKNVLDASANKLKIKMRKRIFEVDRVHLTRTEEIADDGRKEHDVLSRFITPSEAIGINNESCRTAL